MNSRARRLFSLGLALGVMAATGCVKIDSAIELSADGSGTWRLQYALPGYMIRQVEAGRALVLELERAGDGKTNTVLAPLDIPFLVQKEAIEAHLRQVSRDGITVTRLQTREQGDWRHVDITMKFERFADLFDLPFMRGCGVAFRRPNETTCVLTLMPPSLAASEEALAARDSGDSTDATPVLNGLRVVVRVGVPGDIRNSNSTLSDNRRATWQWDFENDQRIVERLARERMTVVFDGATVRMKEFERLPSAAPAR
jgi:hypothetical protein